MSTLKTNQLSNLAADFVIDVKEVQPVGEAYTSLGAYGAGLVFNSYTETFTYAGGKYRPLTTLALPYTTTGVGAGEIVSFSHVGDALLRSDLASSEGAELVGIDARTVDSALRDGKSVKLFGAVGDGVADDTVAINAALADSPVIFLPTGRYRMTSTLNMTGGKTIVSDGGVIEKDHAGVGLAFTGGSNRNYIYGTLEVIAVGTHVSDTSAASTSPGEHGVTHTNNYVVISGELVSKFHKGTGYEFSTTSANSNTCKLLDIRCQFNGVHGFHFAGTNDNASVWRFAFSAFGNRKSGVFIEDDFAGRNWDGDIYCESNSVDTTSVACYLGKVRASSLRIYAEDSQASVLEIVAGANCEGLSIVSYRQNKDEDRASGTSRIVWIGGSLVYRPGAPGDTRRAVVQNFKSSRARRTGPGEYVEINFLDVSNTEFGKIRGEGGSGGPAVSLVSESGLSKVAVSDTAVTTTVAGVVVAAASSSAVLPGVDNTINLGSQLKRYGNTYTNKVFFGSGFATITNGAGSPEGVVTAEVGSLHTATGAASVLYVKQSGFGNTGWVGK